MNSRPLIIMPVKDSVTTAEQAIRAITSCGHSLTVYDDNSSPDTVLKLRQLRDELGIGLIHLSELTSHPSPNYRTVLIHAQQAALAQQRPLLIIESDVIVSPATIDRLVDEAQTSEKSGLIAAVTVNQEGQINFPYDYARKSRQSGTIVTRKRLSFCCTLLTPALLAALDFATLDPEKNWYDVFISHRAVQLGFTNLLMLSNPVLHMPHSSRPWKRLKYTNPIKYYLLKLLHGRDKI